MLEHSMPNLAGIRVLVVEDDRDIREGLEEVLVDEGHQVQTAEHGRAALELLNRLPELPDLILLDLMMPVMDGYQLVDALLASGNPRLSQIPVVLVTAADERAKAKVASKVARVLAKPLDLDELLLTVQRLGKRPERPQPTTVEVR